MHLTLAQLPVNPFEDNIVFEPREAESAVAGLNDGVLAALQQRFERLETAARPRLARPRPPLLAQLVTSAEPGYGKSHLIGRLFRALNRRATRVYLRPFQDVSSAWRSILLKVVQELHRPEDSERTALRAGELTQLDAFAQGVLGHLLAELLEAGQYPIERSGEQAAALRRDPVAALGAGTSLPELGQLMRAKFSDGLGALLCEQLQISGAQLHARAASWLKILFGYGYGSFAQRVTCLEWIKGEGVSDEEAGLLGLDPSEVPDGDNSAAARNELAKQRLEDLLSLAGFFRPFLLCFDQTEQITEHPEACIQFGHVVEELVAHGLNHMLIVTANISPWDKIKKHIDHAQHHRFVAPLQLEGIIHSQAEELARQRLTGCNLATQEQDRLIDHKWLKSLFQLKPEYSVREFLRLCSQRFDQLAGQSRKQPKLTPEESFQHCLNEALSKKGRLDYDPEILRWTVGHSCVGDALPQTEVKAYKDGNAHFPVSWSTSGKLLLWGFEDSSYWKRWNAILENAGRQFHVHRQQQAPLKVIMLRSPEQCAIPGEKWLIRNRFLEAAERFGIHVLAREDWANIVACHDLYVNALEGNLPFGAPEALEFTRYKLGPWWEQFLSGGMKPAPLAPATPEAAETEPPPELAQAIRKVLSTRLFLSLKQLLEALPHSWSQTSVMEECQKMTEVKIFSTSQATALKWKSA